MTPFLFFLYWLAAAFGLIFVGLAACVVAGVWLAVVGSANEQFIRNIPPEIKELVKARLAGREQAAAGRRDGLPPVPPPPQTPRPSRWSKG